MASSHFIKYVSFLAARQAEKAQCPVRGPYCSYAAILNTQAREKHEICKFSREIIRTLRMGTSEQRLVKCIFQIKIGQPSISREKN
jgi:hypothetical protein